VPQDPEDHRSAAAALPARLAGLVGRPEVNVTDIYPLVLAGRGLHFNVKSVLHRVPCPGLVAVRVADMPAMVLVPVWRATADNDGIPAFAEVASSLRRPNDQSR
jgi:hypothetical protein